MANRAFPFRRRDREEPPYVLEIEDVTALGVVELDSEAFESLDVSFYGRVKVRPGVGEEWEEMFIPFIVAEPLPEPEEEGEGEEG